MEEKVFDWKETDAVILFLVKESKKGNDIYLIDLGDDAFHFVVCDQPTTKKEIKQYLIKSYKKMGAKLTSKDIQIKA
jgi:hypothetical protein